MSGPLPSFISFDSSTSVMRSSLTASASLSLANHSSNSLSAFSSFGFTLSSKRFSTFQKQNRYVLLFVCAGATARVASRERQTRPIRSSQRMTDLTVGAGAISVASIAADDGPVCTAWRFHPRWKPQWTPQAGNRGGNRLKERKQEQSPLTHTAAT